MKEQCWVEVSQLFSLVFRRPISAKPRLNLNLSFSFFCLLSKVLGLISNFALIQGYLNPSLNNPAYLLLGQISSDKRLIIFFNCYYFICRIIFQSVHNAKKFIILIYIFFSTDAFFQALLSRSEERRGEKIETFQLYNRLRT